LLVKDADREVIPQACASPRRQLSRCNNAQCGALIKRQEYLSGYVICILLSTYVVEPVITGAMAASTTSICVVMATSWLETTDSRCRPGLQNHCASMAARLQRCSRGPGSAIVLMAFPSRSS
jgi:hypothetical protein